ncbi:MAG: helix-turn-helix domain-containing protein [Symbiobacteriaceae bacterium]|nr:helix-turn-helix domain-containing protein [Symbiobacteriaceae bacterium]
MRLSKSKLGATIGTSREVIRLIENGDYNPSLSLCLRLCWALDKTLDELFWRDKPEIWA